MGTPIRLLVVEDNEDDALLIVRELERGGYDLTWRRVETAEGMAEALDSGPWDLISSDFRMPRFSGPAALALCRERGLDIPFIICSGTIGEEQAVESLRAGAHDFLLKDKLARLCPAVERELREAGNRKARQKAEAEVQKGQERYRLILERMPALTYLAFADERGRTAYVSPQVEEMTGFTAEEWLAEPEMWAQRIHTEDRAAVLAAWGQSVATRQPFTRSYRVLTRDGRTVWWEATARWEIETDTGQPLALGFVRDVTDRRRAEEELQRQHQVLYQSEKLAAMGTLLAGVAHELNNPLGVVVGQAGLLRRGLTEGPVAERAVKIEQAGERCARIVKNFLALAREHPPERRRAHANDIVRETAELFRYPLRVEDIELELDLGEGLPVLWADPHQLHQVLVNLITNARHALHGNPPPRRICLRTRGGPDQVRLEVSDNGPGISPEVQARVFEPFFTTKAPDEGTGLGLSLCRGIVASHGGSIDLESEPGRGALFRINLPVVSTPPAPADSRASQAPRAAPGAAVLVIDDEEDLAGLVAEILALEGYSVETAASGEVALERIRQRAFDVVVSDVKMPEMDGPHLYQEACRLRPDLGRRFLFLTGDAFRDGTREFLEAPGRLYLAKPFTDKELTQAVRQVMDLVQPPSPPPSADS